MGNSLQLTHNPQTNIINGEDPKIFINHLILSRSTNSFSN